MTEFRTDVAWAAGLFEGEGCVRLHGKAHSAAEAVIGSTDRDVVDQLQAIVGFGAIRTEHRRDGHKTLYRWEVSTFERVQALGAMFWPWLGERRRAKFREVLLVARTGRPRNGAACWRGHARNPENTYMNPQGKRFCIPCRRGEPARR